MALIKAAVKLIVREQRSYRFEGPGLTLGVPEIYASFPELAVAFDEHGLRPRLNDPAEVAVTTNELGKAFGFVSARTFFSMLGIDPVTSIDVPGCEHEPDLVHNLNQPLPASHLGKFGLVVDPGTSEHVLDMKTCLTNIVRALRVGGVLVQFTPIYSYNGGYFSINPNMLHDFYPANGFEELRSYVIMWDRYRPYSGKSRCYPYQGVMGQRHALSDHDQCRFAPHLLLFARKKREVDEIVVPVQDESASVPPPAPTPTGGLRDAARTLFRLLPSELRYSLKARIDRERMLRETRKNSFAI